MNLFCHGWPCSNPSANASKQSLKKPAVGDLKSASAGHSSQTVLRLNFLRHPGQKSFAGCDWIASCGTPASSSLARAHTHLHLPLGRGSCLLSLLVRREGNHHDYYPQYELRTGHHDDGVEGDPARLTLFSLFLALSSFSLSLSLSPLDDDDGPHTHTHARARYKRFVYILAPGRLDTRANYTHDTRPALYDYPFFARTLSFSLSCSLSVFLPLFLSLFSPSRAYKQNSLVRSPDDRRRLRRLRSGGALHLSLSARGSPLCVYIYVCSSRVRACGVRDREVGRESRVAPSDWSAPAADARARAREKKSDCSVSWRSRRRLDAYGARLCASRTLSSRLVMISVIPARSRRIGTL